MIEHFVQISLNTVENPKPLNTFDLRLVV